MGKDLVEIMGRSCQSHGKIFLYNHGKILQNHGKILLKSWQDFGKILQNHGKILLKSWQDLVKVMARSCMARSWQDRRESWQDLLKIMARPCQIYGKILARSCRIMARSHKKPVLATYKVKQLFTAYVH